MSVSPIYRNKLKDLVKYFKPDVKEFIMNKPKEVWLEYEDGHWERIIDPKLDFKWAETFAEASASHSDQKFNTKNPTLSFKIPKLGNKHEERGGHRVQVFYDSTTEYKFSMAIRLYRGIVFSIDDYQMTAKEKEGIIDAVKSRENLLISGGTGTGKTSFLNMLLRYIDKKERLVTIQGVPELIVPQENHCALYYSENETFAGNKQVSHLLNDTLRMRPDRIILGELRKENSFIFARAINTGHEGSLATVHANSPTEAIEAIVDNTIINGDAAEGAINIFSKQLRNRIYGVVQLKRIQGGVKANFELIL